MEKTTSPKVWSGELKFPVHILRFRKTESLAMRSVTGSLISQRDFVGVGSNNPIPQNGIKGERGGLYNELNETLSGRSAA